MPVAVTSSQRQSKSWRWPHKRWSLPSRQGLAFHSGNPGKPRGFLGWNLAFFLALMDFLCRTYKRVETFISDLCLFKDVVTLLGASCQMVKLFPRVYYNSRSFRGTAIWNHEPCSVDPPTYCFAKLLWSFGLSWLLAMWWTLIGSTKEFSVYLFFHRPFTEETPIGPNRTNYLRNWAEHLFICWTFNLEYDFFRSLGKDLGRIL